MTTYTNWQATQRQPLDLRDECLDAITDAMFTVPMVETADYHASLNQQSWMYVFGHQRKNYLYRHKLGSVHGEELSYIFGAPIVQIRDQGGNKNYSESERNLSHELILYWSSFAATG